MSWLAKFQALILVTLPATTWADEQIHFFESKVRPLLAESCYECHSEKAGKKKGGLWLDRRAGWAVGGDSGAAIIPGDVEGSLLIQMIRYHDPDIAMPPKKKLRDAEITTLETWVKIGAPDPRTEAGIVTESTVDLEEGRKFWSFQPISKPAGDIDSLILTKLEENDLKPAKPASSEVLLRRTTLLLTGFPPTLSEQDRFLSSEESFEQLVDRLLATKAFAERWGRHWLDIARYADTSGGGRAMPLPNAWRYRDYVIDSFHDNKPLNQLIREHIAGDLLPAETDEQRLEQIRGTGFLVLGPHNYENQDKELLDLEIADEQMDTIGRSFLGMTIGCARCHDHKFDPIPTKDYYALAGIFLSTKSVNHSNVSKWNTHPIPRSSQDQTKYEEYLAKEKMLRDQIGVVTRKLRSHGKMSVSLKGNSIPQSELGGIVVDDAQAELVGEWKMSTSQYRWVDSSYIHDLDLEKGAKSVTFRPKIEKSGRYEVRIAYSQGSNRASNTPVTIGHTGGETKVILDQRKRPEHDNLTTSVGILSSLRVKKQ